MTATQPHPSILCKGCRAPGPDVPLDGGYCSTCMARRRAEMCFRRKQHSWGKPCKACLYEGPRGSEAEAVVVEVRP